MQCKDWMLSCVSLLEDKAMQRLDVFLWKFIGGYSNAKIGCFLVQVYWRIKQCKDWMFSCGSLLEDTAMQRLDVFL